MTSLRRLRRTEDRAERRDFGAGVGVSSTLSSETTSRSAVDTVDAVAGDEGVKVRFLDAVWPIWRESVMLERPATKLMG